MTIYEMLNDIDEEETEVGVNPLSYVTLNCAR
jgi:hypothetical protein